MSELVQHVLSLALAAIASWLAYRVITDSKKKTERALRRAEARFKQLREKDQEFFRQAAIEWRRFDGQGAKGPLDQSRGKQ